MSIDTVSGMPLDIGEVLGDTFAVIGRTFVLLANVALMFVAIPAVIRIAGIVLLPLSPAFGFLSAIGLAAGVVGALLAWAAIYQIAMMGLHGESATHAHVLDKAAQRFWPLLVLVLLAGLGVFFGLVLLIVPGVILGLAWSVAFPALVLEDRGVRSSFGRSVALTRGKRWSIFVLYFMVTIVTLIVELVLFALFGGFHNFVPGQGSVLSTVLSSLISVVTIPFGAVLSTALFNRLRGEQSHGAEAVAEVFA
jgi:hypothetical protein